MKYRIEIETRVRRELQGLPGQIREIITEAVDDLEINPRPPGAKRLVVKSGYRLRKGDYRILYTVDDKAGLVRIYRIGHRRDIYRKR